MKPVIVTEAIEVKDGKLVLSSPVANVDDQSPILNNGLAFSYETQQWFPIFKDDTDEEGKTWLVESSDAEGKKLGIQYTSLVNLLSGISNTAVITTETITIEDKKAVLIHKPWNHYGMCPVLNLGYALVRKADGSVMYLPTAPDKDDAEGKTILIPIDDSELHFIEGATVAIQYLYEYSETTTEYPVICTETVDIIDGKLTLSNEPNNLDNQYPFLNFGIVTTTPDDEGNKIQFNVTKVADNVISIPDISDDDIALLEGKQAIVQYVKLNTSTASVDLTDGAMTADALGITEEMIAEAKSKAAGGASDIDLSQLDGAMTSEQIGIDPDMLRKAREEAETRDSISDEDDIIDGEFVEVGSE